MIFVSYCSKDDEPMPGEELGLISQFVSRLVNRIPGLNFPPSNELNDIYFFAADKRLDPISFKLVKEIRARPIMISFVSENYFNSAHCRYETELFFEFYGEKHDFSQRHIIVDLDKIMAHDYSGEVDFTNNENFTLINSCIEGVNLDDSDREWLKQVYRRLKKRNSRIIPLFDNSHPIYPNQLSYDNETDKAKLLQGEQDLRPYLKELISTFARDRTNRNDLSRLDHNQRVHISAEFEDIYSAIELARILWPNAIITSPPFLKLEPDSGEVNLKLKIGESEYLTNCSKHITFSSKPKPTSYIKESFSEFVKAKDGLFNFAQNCLVLVANDNDAELIKQLSTSKTLKGAKVDNIKLNQGEQAEILANYLREKTDWRV